MLKRMMMLAVVAAIATGAAHASSQGTAPKTIMDGAFTAEQAQRGLAAYVASCNRCHGEELTGNQAALRDDRFIERWREDEVDLLFENIKRSMPRGNPATLPDQTYLDIVAFLLERNGYPAGNTELTMTNYSSVMFVGKNGPAAVPNLTSVEVVGCLNVTPNGVWNLTNGTDPVRARRGDEATADEVKAGAAKPLGAKTYRLNLDTLFTGFEPDPHKGHKMYIKGVLNRQAAGERINVTAIGMAAEACTP